MEIVQGVVSEVSHKIVQGVVSEVNHKMWQLTVDTVTQAKISCHGETAEIGSRNWAVMQYCYYYYLMNFYAVCLY